LALPVRLIILLEPAWFHLREHAAHIIYTEA
jgi:hypothetical protein